MTDGDSLISNIKYRALTHIECRVIVSYPAVHAPFPPSFRQINIRERDARPRVTLFYWLLAKSKPTSANSLASWFTSLRFNSGTRVGNDVEKFGRGTNSSSVSFERSLKKKKKERKERKKKALSLRFVCPLAYNRSAKRYSRDVVKKREEKKRLR